MGEATAVRLVSEYRVRHVPNPYPHAAECAQGADVAYAVVQSPDGYLLCDRSGEVLFWVELPPDTSKESLRAFCSVIVDGLEGGGDDDEAVGARQ